MERINEGERRLPTRQDFQDLEIKVNQLGRGDLIHEISPHMSVLRDAIKQSETKGWPEWLLNGWYKELADINRLIFKANMEKAKERGI